MRKPKNLENKKDKNCMEGKKGKWRDGVELKRIPQKREQEIGVFKKQLKDLKLRKKMYEEDAKN
jgi:hypothetical protein